jgi:oxygen-dependent protoporphyrinogen oxidase
LKTAIVGAGISGLATAHALLQKQADLELVVFEADARVGGKVWTEKTPEGYLCEGGVNGFLNNRPKTLELSGDVGLAPLASHASAQKRYIFSKSRLHLLPESPPAFLSSGLLSLLGRLRVMYEIVAPGPKIEDETLAEFATRRLGREAFEVLIDPMASGVFAGDPQKMSLQSCFPRIRELEQEYGSLIRGMIRLQLEARKSGEKRTAGAGPGGSLTSFLGGMGELTDTLATLLGTRIRTATAVEAVSRSGSVYQLQLAGGQLEEAERVILASPAWAQATMLRDFAPELTALLEEIPYPALSVCCFGYGPGRIAKPLDGFGFLVPSREKRRILGTIVDSSVFDNRAPEGATLLRSMVGGARAPQLAQLPDDRFLDLVRGELADILGLTEDPDFIRIYRHERAIPQYPVGHAARLDAIGAALGNHPGLLLTGNAFRGVSLNDCITNAYRIAHSEMF